MSRTWTIDEASADLPALLEAARTSPQYVAGPDGRFEVRFEQDQRRSLDELLDNDVHLEKGDVDGI
ncbi:hypothetical protein [Ciceribacter sp. L1K22]|uniref:hypothetical protein n=1 Tax=Ciceribacter sp. L1K22 TaxID=2820275 RepID=UPI001ABE4F75|nr:hypothetical protein [Ciceribacter sp. L1K22]MBO3760130.1 hypothetical protein [Ciceribacter sp. L1K22]